MKWGISSEPKELLGDIPFYSLVGWVFFSAAFVYFAPTSWALAIICIVWGLLNIPLLAIYTSPQPLTHDEKCQEAKPNEHERDSSESFQRCG